MKLILLIFLFGFLGCTSMQKKNLATENGVISALFNIPESTVESLRTKGLEDEQILKLLIISTATYLTLPEILSMMEDGVSLHEIATDTGIEQELLQERLDKIKKDLNTYKSNTPET